MNLNCFTENSEHTRFLNIFLRITGATWKQTSMSHGYQVKEPTSFTARMFLWGLVQISSGLESNRGAVSISQATAFNPSRFIRAPYAGLNIEPIVLQSENCDIF